jgi:hypothetical protein
MGQLQKVLISSAIKTATPGLVNHGGIQAPSMAKSGQSGNVSPATIYLYFNKQDLVNQLYLDVKVAFCSSGFKGHEPNVAVKTVLNAFGLTWQVLN